jgi:hypothetical protein
MSMPPFKRAPAWIRMGDSNEDAAGWRLPWFKLASPKLFAAVKLYNGV